MSNIITYRCDKCKKEIKSYNLNAVKINRLLALSYDLCDDCLKKLVKYIECDNNE